MTYAGRVANGVKRIEQPAYPLVGGVNIILGDMSQMLSRSRSASSLRIYCVTPWLSGAARIYA
jgi:hypothetical protein